MAILLFILSMRHMILVGRNKIRCNEHIVNSNYGGNTIVKEEHMEP